MTAEATKYTSFLLDILKPREVGRFEIAHEMVPAGTQLRRFNPEQGIYWDTTDKDFPIVTLRGGRTEWMSTEPFDQDTTRPSIDEASGDVLVAGLGLGMVSLAMASKADVRSVHHVELHLEVVDLVWDQLMQAPDRYHPEKLTVQNGDVVKFLQTSGERFDYIHLDIWPDPITAISAYRSGHELASQRLRPNGRAWTWLQENVHFVEESLARGTGSLNDVAPHPHCTGCGRLEHVDYGGLCTDCAEVLGISERFPERPEQTRAVP